MLATRLLAAVSVGAATGGAQAFVSPFAPGRSPHIAVSRGYVSSTVNLSFSSSSCSRRRWATGLWSREGRFQRSLLGAQSEATDRSAQAEAKYREALSEAQRVTREYGGDSAQARAAWDVVDEIEASNNSIAWRPNLDEACDVIDPEHVELCRQYDADVERLEDLLVNGQGALGGESTSEPLFLNDIKLVPVPRLSSKFPPSGEPNFEITSDSQGGATRYTKLIGERDCVLYEHVRGPSRVNSAKAFLRGGPRGSLHFKPTAVRAAVVTCGGLCPGLNSVIHHVVLTLLNIYKADKVLGIRGGFAGFFDEDNPPVDLTTKAVELLQHEPGSVLGSSRGGFDLDKIIEFINNNQINQLYIIGGDGTHRGAVRIATECMARNLNVAVAGIPKTIDNDVDIIDRSFGFLTSIEAAQDAIISATTEARCAIPNGVGVVKLMGRSAGFIAAFATLASGDVDLCLVPESDIVLRGPRGCLPHVMNRVKEKGYAVVVVAEGAGEELLGQTGEVDATGHKKHPPVGPFMKEQIEAYFKEHGEVCNVKYIDPSYMIRSVPANSYDQIYCMQLAQNAVHGAMAGYTAFSVGMVNDRIVYLPMSELVANSPRTLNPLGRTWENVLTVTRQPSTEGSRSGIFA